VNNLPDRVVHRRVAGAFATVRGDVEVRRCSRRSSPAPVGPAQVRGEL